MSLYYTPTRWPAPGTIVSVPAYLVFHHKGIVSDRWHDGKPMVISNSARAGGVAEEPWDVFSRGQQWKTEGYPGQLGAWEVLRRARLVFPRYDVIKWNCEGFVAYCHGLPLSSPQLAAAFLIAAASLLATAARS